MTIQCATQAELLDWLYMLDPFTDTEYTAACWRLGACASVAN